jgi:phosphoribosylformylglycinamidine synthase subunit PurSL
VMPDVRRAITMDVKRPGDAVFIVGLTRNEMGGSEYFQSLGKPGGFIPRVDKALSKPMLDAFAGLTAAGLVNAAHDCSDGGLGVTLAEMAFAGGFGMAIDANTIPRDGVSTLDRALFSESQSRIVFTAPRSSVRDIHHQLAHLPHAVIGEVISAPVLSVEGLDSRIGADLALLKSAWQAPLSVMAS